MTTSTARWASLALALVASTAMTASARAAAIYSSDSESVSVDADYDGVFTAPSASAVTIAPHPAWQTTPVSPGDPAAWISYANTGVGAGATLAPFNPGCSAATPEQCKVLMRVTETFTADVAAQLSLRTWADDTVAIYLDDVQVVAPNFTQDTCADGSPGCEADEFALIDQQVAAGTHVLRFDVYQVGQSTNPPENPFGLLYTGTIEAPVPEPLSIALVGIGLIGLGFASRRRQRGAIWRR